MPTSLPQSTMTVQISPNQALPWRRNAPYGRAEISVVYHPGKLDASRYQVEAFVPATHATIRDARYVITDHPDGMLRETHCLLNQNAYSGVWVRLSGTATAGGPAISEFAIDPTHPDSGRVEVFDTTGVQVAGKIFETSFAAIRWTPAPPPLQPGLYGVFDSPVGTDEARRGPFGVPGNVHAGRWQIWVPEWYDFNPIGSRYKLGASYAVHTGADLNRVGGVAADKDQPVYAVADGIVRSSAIRGTWKGLVVVEHPIPGEAPVYARYAHLHSLAFRAGDEVRRGDVVGKITEFVPNNYHLHFDLSRDPILVSQPGHWPGDNPALVKAVYLDPLAFIRARRP